MEAPKDTPQPGGKVFWCSQKGRLVAADFTWSGPPFLGWSLETLSCSAVDPPNLFNWSQRCLDPTFRREIRRGRPVFEYSSDS